MAENDLEARLATISTGPGVYLLKDAHGKVIYVGKAVNLRSRVRSYVRGGDERSQVRFLVGKLADVDTLVTANEKEALILENSLIKQYKPRYNIRLKDDKSYVSVKVTVTDPVAARPRHAADREGRQPLLRAVPQRGRGARHARHDPQGLSAPHLQRPVFKNRSRPCIEYDIKRCPRPVRAARSTAPSTRSTSARRCCCSRAGTAR
jgi:excinuclease ABC subunit C